jgi:hypothetical protein
MKVMVKDREVDVWRDPQLASWCTEAGKEARVVKSIPDVRNVLVGIDVSPFVFGVMRRIGTPVISIQNELLETCRNMLNMALDGMSKKDIRAKFSRNPHAKVAWTVCGEYSKGERRHDHFVPQDMGFDAYDAGFGAIA